MEDNKEKIEIGSAIEAKKEDNVSLDLAENLVSRVLSGEDDSDADLAVETVMDQYIEKTVTQMIGEATKATIDPTEKFKEIYAVCTSYLYKLLLSSF